MSGRAYSAHRFAPAPRLLGDLRSESAREDLLLSAALVLGGQLEIFLGAVDEHPLVAAACTLGMTSALIARRRQPVPVLAVVFLLFVVQSAAGVPSNAQVATIACILVAGYSVGAHSAPRPTALGLAIGLLGAGSAVSVSGGGPSDLAFATLVVAGPWSAGVLVRRRTEAALVAEQQARDLAVEAQARIQRAAEDERARIARELHDVVMHGLSAMVVQATAAEALIDGDPRRAHLAMRQVQDTGRDAMGQMKTLLGVLRPVDGDSREPQPTLADIHELVRVEQATGRSVNLAVEGEARQLPRGLDLSAYRIVQEALTNVRKHAGTAAADVRLRFTADALEVEVTDDGTAADPVTSSGYGLTGMRERARLYGGRLEAGPCRDAPGWSIRVRFPLERKQ